MQKVLSVAFHALRGNTLLARFQDPGRDGSAQLDHDMRHPCFDSALHLLRAAGVVSTCSWFSVALIGCLALTSCFPAQRGVQREEAYDGLLEAIRDGAQLVEQLGRAQAQAAAHGLGVCMPAVEIATHVLRAAEPRLAESNSPVQVRLCAQARLGACQQFGTPPPCAFVCCS